MAIYSAVPPPPEHQSSQPNVQQHPPPAQPQTPTAQHLQQPQHQHAALDIDAWTISALQSLSVSPVARGIGSPLSIPIDQHTSVKQTTTVRAVAFTEGIENAPPRRPPSRRDSQVRREAILKGKEGSRQRRRWENDRLVGVPNAQPPQPTDWEVHPTHPIHRVPYQLAQFWDRGVRQRAEERTAQLQATRKKQQRQTGSATGISVGEVPRDLRETAKRSPAVRSWIRGLEEPVRQYLQQGQGRRQSGQPQAERDADTSSASSSDDVDSEDEEIVFVGRNGAMRDMKDKKPSWKTARREVSQETVDSGLVFDSFGDDESASFKRWLTHAISDYYGLESRSVVLPNSSRKVVYVGLKQVRLRTGPLTAKQLPRPLWEACSAK